MMKKKRGTANENAAPRDRYGGKTMSYAVVTDTSGNLLNQHVRKYDLKVIPFSYYVENEEKTCLDTDTFEGERFYSLLGKGTKVTTSQITPSRYAEYFTPILAEGKDIIYVSMSSGISGSCDSSRIGAAAALEAFPQRKIEVIDTLGASLGEGLVAIRAAKLRDAGMDFDTAVRELRAYSQRMLNVFTVDDLMFLKRGGRLSNLAAAVGTVLHIKPLLKGSDSGKIVAFTKVRGRRKAIESLAGEYEQFVRDPEKQTVGIAHAGCKKDAEKLAELLKKLRPPKEILIVDYEPVTGSHVGPGALALFFESFPGIRKADLTANLS